MESQQLFIKFNCHQVYLKDSWFTYTALHSKGVLYGKCQKETIILAGAHWFVVELISNVMREVPMFCLGFFHNNLKKDTLFQVSFIKDFWGHKKILYINDRKPDWCCSNVAIFCNPLHSDTDRTTENYLISCLSARKVLLCFISSSSNLKGRMIILKKKQLKQSVRKWDKENPFMFENTALS